MSNKKAFDFTRGNMFTCDPITELCIVGGQNAEFKMPEDEWGDLDTECEEDDSLYDERCGIKLDEDKIANVDAIGITTPIIIAKRILKDGTEVAAVVEGRQRVRMARVVNRRRKLRGDPMLKVPAVVRRGDENDLMGVMIAGNEVRTDDSLEVKIEKAIRMINRGVPIETVANRFGKNVVTVKGWLAYDEGASAALKKAVESGRLAQSAASHIAKLPPAEQETALKEALALPATGKKVTRAAAKAAAKRASKPGSTSETLGLREQKWLLAAVLDKKHPSNTSEKTFAFWAGVESALSLVTGSDDGIDERLSELLKTVREARKEK